MEFHEIANIFPMMIGNEYRSLVTDIRENGLREPITTYEGKILDGRNRYAACLECGIEPLYREWDGRGSPISFVVSLNLQRRHLTSSQRAAISIDLESMYAIEAKERQGTRTDIVEIIPQSDFGKAREQAAKDMNTNARYVQDAKMLSEKAPDLFYNIKSGEMTIPEAKREIVKRERIETPPLPSDKYRIIYADPPWKYGNSGAGIDYYGPAERHYISMSIDELCNLPVKELADSNAVLFLWVTSPLLAECWGVIKAWGFEYKTSFIWDKVKHNYGHYNSVRHELLLICTRGSCTPDNSKLYDSVQSIERSEVHSEKPEEFRNIIDDLYTTGKRIELFARIKETIGTWEVWGNEPNITRID